MEDFLIADAVRTELKNSPYASILETGIIP